MRIAVLSDIHANLTALEAVLTDAGEVDAVWQLGDIVGYGPDPDRVVARLREVRATGVRGNHDAAACGGSEIDWFNPEARRAMEWTREAISSETVDWLRTLPDRRTDGECELVHGSFREPLWEYVTSEQVARANLGALGSARVGLHGHTHMPVVFVEGAQASDPSRAGLEVFRAQPGMTLDLEGRRALVNPGSVGQPRDGDPRASYLVWEPEADRVTWHRVAYDVASVQHSMRAAGLPASLAARLSFGL
jgi:predicted phosphodiesterase